MFPFHSTAVLFSFQQDLDPCTPHHCPPTHTCTCTCVWTHNCNTHKIGADPQGTSLLLLPWTTKLGLVQAIRTLPTVVPQASRTCPTATPPLLRQIGSFLSLPSPHSGADQIRTEQLRRLRHPTASTLPRSGPGLVLLLLGGLCWLRRGRFRSGVLAGPATPPFLGYSGRDGLGWGSWCRLLGCFLVFLAFLPAAGGALRAGVVTARVAG